MSIRLECDVIKLRGLARIVDVVGALVLTYSLQYHGVRFNESY